MPGFFRRQYLVEPKFQMSFMGFSLIVAVMVSSIFYVGYHFTFGTFSQTREVLGANNPDIGMLLDQQILLMDRLFWMALASSFLGIMILGLQMSNRVAGPIFRLRKHLSEYSQSGQFRPIEFRKNDFFKELADDMNKAFQKKLG